MSGDPEGVQLRVQMRFGDRVLSESYRFPSGHLEFLRRPTNPFDPMVSNPRDVWDFSSRLEMRRKIIDMIAINISASIATAFDKEFL